MKELDNLIKTSIMLGDQENPMTEFQALKEAVLAKRQATVDTAEAVLAQEIASDKIVVTFSGPGAIDDLFAWLNS